MRWTRRSRSTTLFLGRFVMRLKPATPSRVCGTYFHDLQRSITSASRKMGRMIYFSDGIKQCGRTASAPARSPSPANHKIRSALMARAGLNDRILFIRYGNNPGPDSNPYCPCNWHHQPRPKLHSCCSYGGGGITSGCNLGCVGSYTKSVACAGFTELTYPAIPFFSSRLDVFLKAS